MLRFPFLAKLAGAGAAGLMLAGGAAAQAPQLTTVLTAAKPSTPSTAGSSAHAKRLGIRARRLVFRSEADVLHLTPRQLRSDIRGGTSVEQLAAKAGMDKAQFTAAVVADLKPRLDRLVKAGRINQAQADHIIDRVQKGWLPGWTLKPGAGTPAQTNSA